MRLLMANQVFLRHKDFSSHIHFKQALVFVELKWLDVGLNFQLVLVGVAYKLVLLVHQKLHKFD